MIIRMLRFVAAPLVVAALGFSQTGTTVRVSVSSSGQQGNGGSYATRSSISADGNVIAFESLASNLVPGDTNGTADIFVHDQTTHGTTRISVSSTGHEANNASEMPSISGDGRLIAFWSVATNLDLPFGSSGAVYLHDRVTGETRHIGDAGSIEPSVSADGRFVAYSQVSIGTGMPQVINVYDVDAETSMFGVGSSGSFCASPALSSDGRFLAFTLNIPQQGRTDVYRRDLLLGVTTLVSPTIGSQPPDGYSVEPAISPNGERVAFRSLATNLIVGDTNAADDVYMWEASTGSVSLVSRTNGGAIANGSSVLPQFSPDGRYLGYMSSASDIVPGDTNANADGFVLDTTTGQSRLVTVAGSGAIASLGAGHMSVARDATIIAFSSAAPKLVASDTNGAHDVFVSGIGVSPGEPFCFGDGPTNGGPDCPCGNNVGVGIARGCTNSTGNGGKLVATGNASLSADTVTLTGSDMAPASFSLFLQSPTNAGAAPYFFDGLRCVGPSFVRLTTKMSVAGAAAIGSPATPISILGGIASPGTQYYQVVYRNNAGLCNFLANSTNGVAVTWLP